MYKVLYYYAFKTLNEDQAEDAVHRTFLIAIEKFDNLKISDNPEGWIFNCHKNVIKKIKEENSKYHKALSEIEFELSNDEVDVSLLYKDVLSDEDFSLLIAVYCRGSSLTEIAEDLKISYQTCKKRVLRARNRLKKYFEKCDL